MNRNNPLKSNGGLTVIKILPVMAIIAFTTIMAVMSNGTIGQNFSAQNVSALQQFDPSNKMFEQAEETDNLPATAVEGQLAIQDTKSRSIELPLDAPLENDVEQEHSLAAILLMYRTQLDENPDNGLGIPDGCEVNTNHEFEGQLLRLINKERTRLGLDALTWNDDLANAARKHSVDMACNDFFSHTNLDGETFNERIAAEGYEYYAAGEDLFAGDDAFNTPKQSFIGWYNSSAHYKVMTHPELREVGIGYVYAPDSRYGGYFTADFGSPE